VTPFDVVKARLAAGRVFTQRFAAKDRRASWRFLDAAALQLESPHVRTGEESFDSVDGDLPIEQTQGQINFLTINTIVKLHNIAIADPDFDVECSDPSNAALVRETLRVLWEKNEWSEEARAAELAKDISGMGFLFYRWDEREGPCLEQVDSWDVYCDPHVTKTSWKRLRWVARRIRMPLDEFIERYGADYLDTETDNVRSEGFASQAVEVVVYWDRETEMHLKGEETLLKTGPNLYGDVPVIVLLGEINPRSPWRLGDFDLASGMQAQLSDLLDALNNQAKHGGTLTAYNPDVLNQETIDSLESGRQQGYLPVEGGDFAAAVYRLPGEPLNPALLESFNIVQKGLDAVQGVNEYQRGVLASEAKTATEAALLSGQSGRRGYAAQTRYEQFVTHMGRCVIKLLQMFAEVNTDEEYELWLAIQDVRSVRVVEASTIFRDPSLEQQSAMQLFDLGLRAFQPMSLTGSVPNLPELWLDVMRAFRRRQPQKYLVSLPEQASEGQREETGENKNATIG